jgi:hypothetical protein
MWHSSPLSPHIAASANARIKETANEEAQSAWDYLWSSSVDGSASLNSAIA